MSAFGSIAAESVKPDGAVCPLLIRLRGDFCSGRDPGELRLHRDIRRQSWAGSDCLIATDFQRPILAINRAAAKPQVSVIPMTQPSNVGLARTAPSVGFFGGRGLLGGLAAGFLGAGLFGLLFGYGLLGGMAGFASRDASARSCLF
jgi:hypothetical protein